MATNQAPYRVKFSVSPAQAAEQLIKRYTLTEEEAQAAVQANW